MCIKSQMIEYFQGYFIDFVIVKYSHHVLLIIINK